MSAAAPAARVRCPKCKKVKAPSNFSNDVTRASGKFPWCKACQLVGNRKAFQDADAPLNGKICPLCDTEIRGHINRRFCSTRCKDRVQKLRLKYGLTPEQYRALVAQAEGRCPICKRRPTLWHVDHNHKTGLATGVVCGACNVGALAFTYHDPEMVRRLLAYLEATPASRLGIEAVGTAPSKPSQIHRVWGHASRVSR